MTDILDEIIGAKEPSTPVPSSAPQEQKIDEELVKKEEQLANLKRAIAEANEQVRKARSQKKQQPEEEELPKINFDDPSARAWERHIGERVQPIASELDKEKEEIRTFAFREFLADKPALAANPEKVKELVSTYERIKTASERTTQGVLLDLSKAYAAVNHDQLLRMARTGRIEKAQADALFSEPAISRGATAYSEKPDYSAPQLSDDDKEVLRNWGVKPDEWAEDKKKYG